MGPKQCLEQESQEGHWFTLQPHSKKNCIHGHYCVPSTPSLPLVFAIHAYPRHEEGAEIDISGSHLYRACQRLRSAPVYTAAGRCDCAGRCEVVQVTIAAKLQQHGWWLFECVPGSQVGRVRLCCCLWCCSFAAIVIWATFDLSSSFPTFSSFLSLSLLPFI